MKLELVVDDGLEQVQGAQEVRGQGLIGSRPGFTDVRLRPEMEDDRLAPVRSERF